MTDTEININYLKFRNFKPEHVKKVILAEYHLKNKVRAIHTRYNQQRLSNRQNLESVRRLHSSIIYSIQLNSYNPDLNIDGVGMDKQNRSMDLSLLVLESIENR